MDEERIACKISTETDATILCWELNSIHASVYDWSSLCLSFELCWWLTLTFTAHTWPLYMCWHECATRDHVYQQQKTTKHRISLGWMNFHRCIVNQWEIQLFLDVIINEASKNPKFLHKSMEKWQIFPVRTKKMPIRCGKLRALNVDCAVFAVAAVPLQDCIVCRLFEPLSACVLLWMVVAIRWIVAAAFNRVCWFLCAFRFAVQHAGWKAYTCIEHTHTRANTYAYTGERTNERAYTVHTRTAGIRERLFALK